MARTRPNPSTVSSQGLWQPRYWPIWLGLGALYLLVSLPYRAQLVIGAGIGWLLRVGLGSRRRIANRNLELCFPAWSPGQRETVLRASFRSLGIMLLETGLAWWGSERRLRRLRHLSGLEYLDRAIAKGQGVLLLAGHFTTLEMGGRMLCHHRPGLKGVLYREHRHPVLQWAVERYRGRYAGALFARTQLRGAVRHLRRGKLLWFAPDQDYERGESVFVPFFGIAAATTVSTHQLARMGHAQVIVMRQYRLSNGRGYRIEIQPPLEGLPSADVKADCERINTEMAALIRETPAQYLWLHRRFKNRPPGAPSLYD